MVRAISYHRDSGITAVSYTLFGYSNCLPSGTLVYTDGKVCISILHPPGDDPNGYELASERWSPVHTVCLYVLTCSLHAS